MNIFVVVITVVVVFFLLPIGLLGWFKYPGIWTKKGGENFFAVVVFLTVTLFLPSALLAYTLFSYGALYTLGVYLLFLIFLKILSRIFPERNEWIGLVFILTFLALIIGIASHEFYKLIET